MCFYPAKVRECALRGLRSRARLAAAAISDTMTTYSFGHAHRGTELCSTPCPPQLCRLDPEGEVCRDRIPALCVVVLGRDSACRHGAPRQTRASSAVATKACSVRRGQISGGTERANLRPRVKAASREVEMALFRKCGALCREYLDELDSMRPRRHPL